MGIDDFNCMNDVIFFSWILREMVQSRREVRRVGVVVTAVLCTVQRRTVWSPEFLTFSELHKGWS